jgi:hypothetical protein
VATFTVKGETFESNLTDAQAIGLLSQAKGDFAASLAESFKKYGNLTDKQLPWAHKLAQKVLKAQAKAKKDAPKVKQQVKQAYKTIMGVGTPNNERDALIAKGIDQGMSYNEAAAWADEAIAESKFEAQVLQAEVAAVWEDGDTGPFVADAETQAALVADAKAAEEAFQAVVAPKVDALVEALGTGDKAKVQAAADAFKPEKPILPSWMFAGGFDGSF